MTIVDTQAHIWEEPSSVTRVWDDEGLPVLDGAVSGDVQVAAMEAVGVDMLLLNVMPHYRVRRADGTYSYDNGYAQEFVEKYPARLRSTPWVDPLAPDLDEVLDSVVNTAGTVGVRAAFRTQESRDGLAAGEFDRLFISAANRRLPIFLAVRGHAEVVAPVASRNPDTLLVVDGLGMPIPSAGALERGQQFEKLPAVVDLARFPNVMVKWAGAQRFSSRPFPFVDVWDGLEPLLTHFGPSRLMFASDWTHRRGHHSYAEAVFYLRVTDRLSDHEKNEILSGTALRLLPGLAP